MSKRPTGETFLTFSIIEPGNSFSLRKNSFSSRLITNSLGLSRAQRTKGSAIFLTPFGSHPRTKLVSAWSFLIIVLTSYPLVFDIVWKLADVIWPYTMILYYDNCCTDLLLYGLYRRGFRPSARLHVINIFVCRVPIRWFKRTAESGICCLIASTLSSFGAVWWGSDSNSNLKSPPRRLTLTCPNSTGSLKNMETNEISKCFRYWETIHLLFVRPGVVAENNHLAYCFFPLNFIHYKFSEKNSRFYCQIYDN